MRSKCKHWVWISIITTFFVLPYSYKYATARPTYEPNPNCQKYSDLLRQKNGIEDSSTSPYMLERYNDECKVTNLQLALILRDYFSYRFSALNRDTPNTQAYKPNTDVNAIYQNNIHQLNELLPHFKNYDKAQVERILHYMVSSKDESYSYAGPALEIVARDFPDSYDSYKLLTQEGTKGRRLWIANKNRWLAHRTEHSNE